MKYTFKDICTKIGSGATPTGGKEAYKGGDYALVRSQNVLDYTFTTSGLAYINETQAKKLDGVKVEVGDVLLNITGDSVARACIIPDEILPARVNQHVAIIRANNQYALNEYLLYFLQYNKQYLLSISQGGGTRSAITKKMIEDIEIDLPSIEDQLAIVNIINNISKKIEVNQQINDNLEQQAQNIFNHYFIDNPIELGSYSEGVLTDIAVYLNGLAMQKFRPEGSDFGLPVLKIKELGQRSCDNNSDRCSSLIKEEYIVNDGDVIFSWSGTLLVDLWCGGKCGLNQHLFKVTSDTYPKWFYYFWTKHHLDNFIRVAKDKAVTMGHIKRTELEKANIIVPTQDKLSEINRIMSPIITKIINHRIEMRKLAQLRDSLLPQLMSGELKINEIDC